MAAAWTLLACTRLLVLLAPFRLIRRLLGDVPGRPTPPVTVQPAVLDERRRERARWIGNLVTGTAKATPWRSDCYPQALTARIILRLARIPHAVTFGVRREPTGELLAHAWVRAGDVTVTGAPIESWTAVATFAWEG